MALLDTIKKMHDRIFEPEFLFPIYVELYRIFDYAESCFREQQLFAIDKSPPGPPGRVPATMLSGSERTLGYPVMSLYARTVTCTEIPEPIPVISKLAADVESALHGVTQLPKLELKMPLPIPPEIKILFALIRSPEKSTKSSKISGYVSTLHKSSSSINI